MKRNMIINKLKNHIEDYTIIRNEEFAFFAKNLDNKDISFFDIQYNFSDKKMFMNLKYKEAYKDDYYYEILTIELIRKNKLDQEIN